MSILYACIAHKKELQSQYPVNKKNITDTVNIILGKIPSVEHKQSYNHEAFVFHYKNSSGYTYMCISTKDFPVRICFALLDDIEVNHMRTRDSSVSALSNMLRDKIAYFNNLDNDKISALKKDVDNTKEVMYENIDKIIERGTKLDVLVEDTQKLSNSAIKFSKTSRKVANRMCVRNILIGVVISIIILILIFIIIWIACGFPLFERCAKLIPPPPGSGSASGSVTKITMSLSKFYWN